MVLQAYEHPFAASLSRPGLQPVDAALNLSAKVWN
jgi:hypothetical protein